MLRSLIFPPEKPKEKIPVGVLGATGSVGQRFVQLLENHPWFEIRGVGASERSAGKPYREAVNWKLSTPIPEGTGALAVTACVPEAFSGCRLVFSGLDSSVAGPVETAFAQAGIAVFSNARNHRMDEDVPILIPYVNADQIDIIPHQRKVKGYPGNGFIVTNANCSSTGLVIALKPLLDAYGIDSLFVCTMQALSGGGYPGVPSMDVLDNVVPYIDGEEDKLQSEPMKILGRLNDNKTRFEDVKFDISALCNRVPVLDGHTECVSIKLTNPPDSVEKLESTLTSFVSTAASLPLPSARPPIAVTKAKDRPQPRLDRDVGQGYTVTVGQVRPDPIFHYKFTLLSHNTVIGAAGGSILNAELALVKGYIS